MTLKNSMLIAALALAGILPDAVLAQDQNLNESLKAALPGAVISGPHATPLPGIKAVIINGQLGYASDDGRYLLRGQLVDNTNGQIVGEDALAAYRAEQLSGIADKDKIIARPKGKAAHRVVVFVDTSCGYCRALHEHESEYLAQGIELQYVAYPLAGLGEGSKTLEAVWCAADQSKALTAAYAGESVQSKPCANPVSFTYTIGREIGVSGTPAIFTMEGYQVGGYVPADKLKHDLDLLQGKAP